MMRVNDILHSCSHGHVAEAAVVSIGGAFANDVKSSAAARGQTVGEFASQHVIQFSQDAGERDWRIVADRMQRADLALLAGLEALMTRMMGGDVPPRSGPTTRGGAAA
jgi:hypothetical protein